MSITLFKSCWDIFADLAEVAAMSMQRRIWQKIHTHQPISTWKIFKYLLSQNLRIGEQRLTLRALTAAKGPNWERKEAKSRSCTAEVPSAARDTTSST